MSRYDHINFRPPQGARAAAKRALEVRAEKPESQRGMTPVGLARARDLVNGKALSPETVRRMLSFFQRHEVDKKSASWDEQGPSWQAWSGWGGDAGYAWARKVVRQMDAADEEARNTSETEPHTMDDDTSDDSGDDMDEAEFAEHGATVVPYQAFPVADGDTWDADAAVQRLRKWAGVDEDAPAESAWRKYAQGFAVVRGPADRLGSYLLPHHDVKNGRLVTSPAGVSAAVAALKGARGGVDVPDAVKARALAHLERHQRAVEDAREASDVHGASEVITCRDAAQVGHRTWNQIARFGEWRAHPAGPFRFTASEFAAIVKNFRALENGRVPVDYEHASERHPENVAQQGVPAVAWVVDLDDRGDAGLWAEFEWVDPRAVEYVRTGQYRYLSPAVQFASRDKATNAERGARLTSVALTNHPFLDGMAPVTASETRPAKIDAVTTDIVSESMLNKVDPAIFTTPRGETAAPSFADVTPEYVADRLFQPIALPAQPAPSPRASFVETLGRVMHEAGAIRDTLARKQGATPSRPLSDPTRLGLAPGAVHLPTGVQTTAPTKERKSMNEDTPDVAASAPAPDPAMQKMADLEAQCAQMSADLKAAGERSKAMRDRLAKMAEMDAEADENAALDKVESLIGELRAIQKREAEGVVSERAASYGMSEKALPRMVALYLSDRSAFEEMWPAKSAPVAPAAPAVEAPKPAPVNLSETSAPPAQPKPGTGAHEILANELLPGRVHAQPAGDVLGAAAASKARDELAAKLMREDTTLTFAAAVLRADQQIAAQRRNAALGANVA